MIDSIMPTYARIDVAFERGEGVYLYDSNGRRYLDFLAGIAVDCLGHCHPHLVKELTDQVGKLWHTSNLYRIPGQEKLADRLVAKSFADAVFFTNSGAEAIECGLKSIRRFHYLNGAPQRYRVICARNAFHGRTLATVAAGGQAKHMEGFGPAVEGFDHVAFGNLNEMRAAITPETAAILVEPVQGEGGMTPAPEGYLAELRTIADEFGLLLMFDEVQCGMGRTGRLFAHEWAGIVPDIMAIAKGIGGGFPVGACLAVEKVASVMTAGTHGTTYGGNPLAMAAANAVLDVILEDGFMANVEKTGQYFRQSLEGLVSKYPSVIEAVSGKGLMLGLRATADGGNGLLNNKLFERGLLTALAGNNVVRFVPPLIVTMQHIDDAISIIDLACQELSAP